jgi:hypothetical protein
LNVSHLNKILLEVWSFTSVSEIDSQLLLLLSWRKAMRQDVTLGKNEVRQNAALFASAID